MRRKVGWPPRLACESAKGLDHSHSQAAHMHCKVTFTGIFSSGGSDNKIYNSELSEVL